MITPKQTPLLFDMLETTEARDQRQEHRLPSLGEAVAAFERARGTGFLERLWCMRCSAFTDQDAMPIGEGTLAYSCHTCKGGSRLYINHLGKIRREYVLADGNLDPDVHTVFHW